MSWRFIGHCHTKHSFDARPEPAALAKRAVELGAQVLVVTDHDTWRGSVETRAAAEALGLPLRVILATEAATDQGDVIGLFLKEDVRDLHATRFCDTVHAQGGLVLLPHPYKWHTLDDALLSRVDLIEVHNGRTPRAGNTRAAALALKLGKPELVGPDAHRLSELALASVEFEGELPADDEGLKHALLHAKRRFVTRPGSMWNEWLSQCTKWSRQPTLLGVFMLARGGLRRLMKPKEYALW
jgi:predicted metal-dependent phosphoesterase TrpH